MVDEIIESGMRLERVQSTMEYVLAAVVPSILTLMLFSYVLFRDLFQFFFATAVIIALLMVIPAMRVHKLQYMIWSKNAFPIRLVNSLIGMVYISAVSVFAVSMVSAYEGLSPERPLTFAIMGALVIFLIGLMAYNSRYKDAYLAMQKKHFRKDPRVIEGKVMDLLAKMGLHYEKYPGERRSRVALPESGLVVRITPIGRYSAEVVVENVSEKNHDLFNKIRSHLDGESTPFPSTRPSPSQSLSDERS
jgi:hypothetical protein